MLLKTNEIKNRTILKFLQSSEIIPISWLGDEKLVTELSEPYEVGNLQVRF